MPSALRSSALCDALPALAATPFRAQTLAIDLTAATQAFLNDPEQLRVRDDRLEVNPILDERNRSAVLAVELLESAFGKRIL